MSDKEPQAPKIEFPCHNYPVKIVGDNVPHYEVTVLEIVERHAPGYDQGRNRTNPSSNGRFVSITVMITATGPEQLQALFDDLRATGLVRMVL
ncbi:YbeD family protein [Pokkaliibacter sp. CJK22405]|uniref:YbeD family protein n=1 Tax=Pokkaliibacter sp. CJK22405 TaxID=3384615 RepID=UPI003984CB9B